ncbi:DUF3306 domain-containing protein [Roseateles sp.]|uniref:DUF3306 domain-containing protein n=1 Tax=Roseateles sp. TaxID=1971397 RepID=UPI00286B7D14|nr:DUF3306 domain-containing protein [Roseateles sp.]
MATEDDSGGRLARWSRLKMAASKAEVPPPISLPAEPVEAQPPPGYAEVELLTPASDFARFMGGDVDGGVQRAALKKLFFSDPHFNLMDGLDTYIDDYNKPDPLPLAMLRQLHQSQVLGLFEHETEKSVAIDQAPEPASLPDDDDHPDLRLQQDDDAGRPGADEGAGP